MIPQAATWFLIFLTWGAFCALIAASFYLKRRSESVCSRCSSRVTRANDDLPCPMCDHDPARYSDSCYRLDQPCRICETVLTPESGVRLWDGKCYCNNCVETEAPELLDLARGNFRFREQMQHSPWDAGRWMMKFTFMVVLGFASFMALVFLLSGQLRMALSSFGVFPVIGAPVILLFGFSTARAFRSARPAFIVRDGKLVVRIGSRIFDTPIADCNWWEGKANETTLLRFGQNNDYSGFLKGPAIVIKIPTSYDRVGSQITVGFTEETYRIWRSFLTIADIAHTPKKKFSGKWHQRLYRWWLSPQ